MSKQAAVALALVMVLAGCSSIGGVPGGGPVEETTSESYFADSERCSADLQLSFWGLNEDGFWKQDTARVSYTVPRNESVFLVTYVDGERRGVTRPEPGVHADGAKLRLNATYSEQREVMVVVHNDTNGDGQFDPGPDLPCSTEGDVVRAGPRIVDFGRFG